MVEANGTGGTGEQPPFEDMIDGKYTQSCFTNLNVVGNIAFGDGNDEEDFEFIDGGNNNQEDDYFD